MYLQKLAIQGFKSFANKTALEFTPGVTAIVGPNGSGKSNVADAVRWALGEQSLKTLRGKKSGDVIFAGSDKKTRLGYCQVDLHLNNEDRKAPIDYDEIVITRKIFRDGEGEYYINKNKVRLQDILMLLAKSNFGQRSYSIIGQGTVDLFLSATPTQRKEYFDEAAGVRQFQIKKEQAENKLRQTRENLQQAEMLIQEIEPRLRSLTRQVHRLEKREEVTAELKKIQHIYYAGLWHDLKNKHQAEEKNYHKIELEQKGTDQELADIQEKMRQLALGSSRQDDFQKLQAEYNRLMAEKNQLLREQAVLKGKSEADRQERGEYDLVWLEKKEEQLKNELRNLKQIAADNQTEIKKYTAFFSEMQAKERQLSSELGKINQELEAAKNNFAGKKIITMPEVAGQISAIYQRLKSLTEKIEAAQTPDDLKNIKAEFKALNSQLFQLNRRLGEAESGDPAEIIARQEKITGLIAAKDKLAAAANEANIKLQIAKERERLSHEKMAEKEEEIRKISLELEESTEKKTPSEINSGIKKEAELIAGKIRLADEKISSINKQLADFNQVEQQKKEEVFALQKNFSKKQEELNNINDRLNKVKIELAKLETRQEDLEKEMLDELKDEEKRSIYEKKDPPPAKPELFEEIQKLKRQLELIGGIDPQVAGEYKETKERYDFLTNQSEDLNKAIGDLEQAITSLEETIKKQFDLAFEQINKHFIQYFKILFNGGNASLSLVKEEIKEPADEADEDEADEDEADENEEAGGEEKEKAPAAVRGGRKEKVVTGIDIHATPPGKKLRGIAMLSGGERALTSIALICAIIHNNPSPFVILDEVDAALDESNSIRFASIVDRLSKKAQFIVVTHNRATMNQAHTLYGITMGDDGVSKMLSINMAEAEKVINDKS